MPTNIMQLNEYAQQGYADGRKNRLASLLGQAYQAPQDQRQGLLGQAAQIDPVAAGQYGQNLQQQDDQGLERVAKAAMFLARLPEQARAQAYPSVRGQLVKSAPHLETVLPRDYDQSAAEVVGQFGQIYGGGLGRATGIQSTYVDAEGNRVGIMRDGSTQVLGKNAPNVQILEGSDGFYGVDKGNLSATPVTVGGPAPQAPAQPSGAGTPMMAAYGVDGQPDEGFNALPPSIRAKAQQLMDAGIAFDIIGGKLTIRDDEPQAQTTPTRPQGNQLQPKKPQMTPAQQAQIALAQQANARAEEAARRQALGTPPPGQRFRPDGTLENIPGANPTGQAAKPPSDGEKLSAGFLLRMKDASSGLQNIEAEGYTPGGVRDFYTAGGGPLMNWAASEKGQVYRQQQEDWVRAKLRKESGAAIPAEEMEREIKTYFPQPGDSQSVIESKAKSRATALRAMEIAAGRAASLAGQSGSAAPANESPPVAGARKAPDGNWYVQQNGQWYRVE